MYGLENYEYKGYRYEPWEDIEPEECIKIFHDVKSPDGERLSIDWSPYNNISEEQFQEWIDTGMPNRETVDSIGAFDSNSWDEWMNGMGSWRIESVNRKIIL